MMGEASERGPAMSSMLYVYVKDADATFQSAVKAGAKVLSKPETMFYGDRSGAVADPCGNQWWIATHVEDVPPEELKKRMQAGMKG